MMEQCALVTIFIDADACPVKEETYKVAMRHQVSVVVVSNGYLRIPPHDLIEQVSVGDGFDAADDEIVRRVHARSIVVTSDILLADRCLKLGAMAMSPNGKPFTVDSIGGAVALRAIMADLRAGGEQLGGPPPFTKADRSRYLQMLDQLLVKLKRSQVS